MINKSDLNLQVTSEIEHFLKEEKIIHISNLPYDETFTKAMINGQTIVEYNQNDLNKILTESWDKIKKILLNN
jgi:MinD superfamily P-loop ATPase